MGNVELCLVATKGSPKRQNKTVKQLVIARRTTHSTKPDEVRRRIETLMGPVSRIELFARGDKSKDLFGESKFDGWDVWGNEIQDSIEFDETISSETKDSSPA